MSFRCWKGRRGLFKYLTCCLNSDKAVSQEMSRGKFQSRAVLGTENVTVHAILNNIEKEDQVVCAAPEENEGEDSRQPGIIVEDLECTDDEVTDLESINGEEVVCAAPEENKGDDLRQPGIIVEDLECRNDEVANVESISDEEEWAICTAAEEQEADDSRGPSIVTEVHNPSIKLGGGDCGTTIGDDDHSGSQEDIKTLKLVICYLKKKNDALNEKVKQMEVKLQSAKNFSDYQKKKHEEENKQLEEMASLMKAQLVALADYNTHIEEEFQKVYCEIKTLEVADMLITGERQFLEKIHYLKMVLQEKMNTLEAAGEQTSHLEKKNQNYRNRAINGSECLGELEDTIEAYPEEI